MLALNALVAAEGGAIWVAWQAYRDKPQWLLFQMPVIASFLMEDAAWFIDKVYSTRMATPFQPDDRDYLVAEFAREQATEESIIAAATGVELN